MDVQTLTLEYQFHIHLLKGGVSLHEQDLAGTSWEADHGLECNLSINLKPPVHIQLCIFIDSGFFSLQS